MATKMGGKMIALCSAAIGVVYVAGYMVTGGATDVAASPTPPVAAAASAKPPLPAVPAKGAVPTKQPSKYRDGTYTGIGTNRIGSIEVAVTIKDDKITDVKITNCTTHYSQRYVNQLPQQVLDRQSPRVDVISGATKSTQDFQNAVQQALTKAMI